MWNDGLSIKTIIEPMILTREAVPNLPVAHVTSKSVKKTEKSQNIGSPKPKYEAVSRKPKGPNVKLRLVHKAQKTLTKARSRAVKYFLLLMSLHLLAFV